MSAIDFPNNKSTGTVFTATNNVVYVFDGDKWVGQLSLASVTPGPQGPTGSAGPQGSFGPTGPQGPTIDLTTVSSHIIPSANLNYDLGSPEKQWRSLYVGTGTVYIGGVPVTVNTLTNTLIVGTSSYAVSTTTNIATESYVIDYVAQHSGSGSTSTLVNGTYTFALTTAGVIVLPNLQSIDSSDPTTLVVGTADAKLTLDNFNQAALLQAKKSFNRYFSQGSDGNFIYTNEGGQGVITATVTDLYLRTLLERLAIKFDGNLDFPYSYNNVRVVVNPDVENILTTVTNITYGVGFGEFSIAVDQLPDPDPFTFIDIRIQYDYLNTVGLDVDKDIFGISTDNDDIDIRSGRDIDLQAADDISITAGSIFELELTQSDDQENTEGLKIRVANTLTTHIWAFRFDGVTEFPNNTIDAGTSKIDLKSSDYVELWYQSQNGEWQNNPNMAQNVYVYADLGGVGIQNVRGNDGNDGPIWDYTWRFGNDGGLQLPLGGNITEGTSPTGVGNTIIFAPNGGLTTQALLIYPTTGGDGDHLHLTANGGTTELYLGNDNHYIKLVNGGNVEIRTDDLTTSTATWVFGTNGSLTFPNSTVQTTAFTGIPTDIIASTLTANTLTVKQINNTISPSSGDQVSNVRYWDSAGLNLYVWFNASETPEIVTLGSFGSIIGWTVSVAGGNSATITDVNPAGFFSISTDVALSGVGTLTFTSPGYVPETPNPINVSVASNTWTFGTDGIITFPSGSGIIFDSSATSTITGVSEVIFADGTTQTTAFTGTSALLDILNTNGIDTNYYLTFVENRVAGQEVRADVDLTFNSWSNTLGVGKISVNSVASSTSTTTGALTVAGGIGVGGNVTLGGSLNFADGTTQSTAYTGTLVSLYLLEAYASDTYTLPGSFTEDTCRYSIVNNTVNVSSAWFNTSTYTFTPLKAGYWDITASYDVYRNAEASMVIKKNTSIVASAGSFNAVAQQITKIVYLNGSTDYIQIFNYGGAALSRSQYAERSWFQARWVGA